MSSRAGFGSALALGLGLFGLTGFGSAIGSGLSAVTGIDSAMGSGLSGVTASASTVLSFSTGSNSLMSGGGAAAALGGDTGSLVSEGSDTGVGFFAAASFFSFVPEILFPRIRRADSEVDSSSFLAISYGALSRALAVSGSNALDFSGFNSKGEGAVCLCLPLGAGLWSDLPKGLFGRSDDLLSRRLATRFLSPLF
jgi:hypothetical protein